MRATPRRHDGGVADGWPLMACGEGSNMAACGWCRPQSGVTTGGGDDRRVWMEVAWICGQRYDDCALARE